MKAVWSYWSRPIETHKEGNSWCQPIHHLLAWGISLRAAQRHYPDTVLVTDLAGRRLLVDKLGLAFSEVSTELERLRDVDPKWWALGKLVAYSLQDRPFLHIDTDVFLWNPLPPHVVNAPVFAQNPEYPAVHPLSYPYGPLDIERAFAAEGIELPLEWQSERSRDDAYYPEENCGIVGGNRTDFLRYYSGLALDLVMNPRHRGAMARLGDKGYNMIVEQFLLAACVRYHRRNPDSPFKGVKITHLFRGAHEAYEYQNSTRAGFTHLMCAKSHPAVGRRMEERVKREDPAYFRQCEKLAAS
jgi:hypothetical protein